MSEYQYYEFLGLDRALSPRQMHELRRVSSRAEITPSRFTNFYDFGEFKGDPARWMEVCSFFIELPMVLREKIFKQLKERMKTNPGLALQDLSSLTNRMEQNDNQFFFSGLSG